MVIYGCVWARLVPGMGTKRVDSPSSVRLADVSSLEDQWDGADILVALAQKETFGVRLCFDFGQNMDKNVPEDCGHVCQEFWICTITVSWCVIRQLLLPSQGDKRTCCTDDQDYAINFQFYQKTISLVLFSMGLPLPVAPEPESHFR